MALRKQGLKNLFHRSYCSRAHVGTHKTSTGSTSISISAMANPSGLPLRSRLSESNLRTRSRTPKRPPTGCAKAVPPHNAICIGSIASNGPFSNSNRSRSKRCLACVGIRRKWASTTDFAKSECRGCCTQAQSAGNAGVTIKTGCVRKRTSRPHENSNLE